MWSHVQTNFDHFDPQSLQIKTEWNQYSGFETEAVSDFTNLGDLEQILLKNSAILSEKSSI